MNMAQAPEPSSVTPVKRTRKPRTAAPESSAPTSAVPQHVADIRLTADRLLVKLPDESERKSKGGLLIPATATSPARRCLWSQVNLVGPEARHVKVGDRVLFLPHAGLEVDIGGDLYLLLREREVQAIATDRDDRTGQPGQYL